MCGIAGIVNVAADAPPVNPDDVRQMTAQLVHRGPDDEGYYASPNGSGALGFRRLSIIDLATGNQPCPDSTGRVQVVFNGEIYNFRALRAELEVAGHAFRTQGDAEVIANAFAAWDTSCFERFEGMFAIGIWIADERRLVLGRDRFGQKPLHYVQHNGRLYFASELKAIAAVSDVPREIDWQAVHRYLLMQYVPTPHSIYRGFRKLPPGTYLEVRGDRVGAPLAYWEHPTPPTFAGSYDEAQERLAALITAAVRKRLIADVPLGAFLSGGLDSSIVVALMHELGVTPVRTFSIGFPHERYDETAYARRVAAQFGTEHHEHIVTPAAVSVLEKLAWHYDEPFADSSAIPTYYVSQWTRQSVTVALTGDAGDECFAGYDRYRAAQLATRFDIVPHFLRRGLAAAATLLPHSQPRTLRRRMYRFATALAQTPARRYLSWINIFTPAMLAAGYTPDFRRRVDFDEPLRWFAALHDSGPPPAANQANHADIRSYLLDDLLVKVDIASMACSLECRSPFLDHDLMAFALSLPLHWRLGAAGGKRILKDWARPRLPGQIIDRPKMGFGVPIGHWFRDELRDLLVEHVLARDALCGQMFDSTWLHALVNEHLSGRANHEHPLYALLMLELWYRRWRPIG